MADLATYAGVDVGGKRKGFHVAVVDDHELIGGPQQFREIDELLDWLTEGPPKIVALDGPTRCAPKGARYRPGERDLANEVCGIRWTPEESKLYGNPYYEWILNGLELYGALGARKRKCGWTVIEVFPTASWTIWAGPRGKQTRARWTREALNAMGLDGIPLRRLNQDDRDAIAAALTARQAAHQDAKRFGDIVVPAGSVL